MSEISIVTATADDVRSLARERALDETTFGLALEAADRGDAFAARDGAETIGWALTQSFEGCSIVGDLFVTPSFRRQSIGGRLLDAAFEDANDVSRWLAFDPGEGAALALGARRNLIPFVLLLRFAGAIPQENVLLELAASSYRFDVDAIDPAAHRFALDELDRSTVGCTRRDEHRRYAAETAAVAFFSEGEFVGYAYVWQDGRIGPAAAASAAYARQMFAYAMLTLRRSWGATWCTALIPCAASRLTRAALHAGLRIDKITAMAGDVPAPDLSRYIARHGLAF